MFGGNRKGTLPPSFRFFFSNKKQLLIVYQKYQNRAEEKARLIKRLPCKPEDLNLILSSYPKCQHKNKNVLWGRRQEDAGVLSDNTSANQQAPGSGREKVVQLKWRVNEGHQVSTSGLLNHMYTCAHMQAHINVHTHMHTHAERMAE